MTSALKSKVTKNWPEVIKGIYNGYVHPCTNEMHSPRFNPYFGRHYYNQYALACQSRD